MYKLNVLVSFCQNTNVIFEYLLLAFDVSACLIECCVKQVFAALARWPGRVQVACFIGLEGEFM